MFPLPFLVAVRAMLDFEQSIYFADEFSPVQVCVVRVDTDSVRVPVQFSLTLNTGTAEHML